MITSNDLCVVMSFGKLSADITATKDPMLKRSIDNFDKHVKNICRTLLTRGMKGCYVYFTDKQTEVFQGEDGETGNLKVKTQGFRNPYSTRVIFRKYRKIAESTDLQQIRVDLWILYQMLQTNKYLMHLYFLSKSGIQKNPVFQFLPVYYSAGFVIPGL